IRNIFSTVPLMNGAKVTARELKKRGYQLAILSAGISLLAERVQKELEIDYVFANKLCIDKKGFLTGEGEAMVDLLSKEVSLTKLIEYTGVNANKCVALGDSEFDIPMFKHVGLSIAFNSSDDSTKQAADKLIEIKDLRAILPFLG
ncbi:MAG: HAD-IB family phosphatase, partial [Candidatus Hodarchaeales archaeon]